MYRLCWISKAQSSPYKGVPHSVAFESLDELKKTMSKCLYNGEWVVDDKGNDVEINWNEVCLTRR